MHLSVIATDIMPLTDSLVYLRTRLNHLSETLHDETKSVYISSLYADPENEEKDPLWAVFLNARKVVEEQKSKVPTAAAGDVGGVPGAPSFDAPPL